MNPHCEWLIEEAKRYLDVQEKPKNSNRGLHIDYWLNEVGLSLALPWCAAFVFQMGRQALGRLWPLPRTASCWALGEHAKKHNVLMQYPERGRVFLLWNVRLKRFAHTGIVTWTDGVTYKTIEGNTNSGGSRDGYGVFERTRRVGPLDRFIDWETLVHAYVHN